MRSIGQLCCAVVALLAAAGTLRADALRRPALHWSRGAEAWDCIDPIRLAQRVEAITGPVFVSATSADNSIEAHVERRAPNLFSVRVATANAAGATLGARTLEFRAQSCREIDEAVAFVVAVAIDPALGAEGLPDEVLGIVDTEEAPEQALLAQLREQPAAAVSARPALTKAVPAPTPPSRPTARSIQRLWRIDLEASLAVGAAPTVAAGLLLAVSRALTRGFDLALQLQAASGLASEPIDAVHSMNGSSLALALFACPRWEVSQRVALRGCAGPFGGVAIASGSGFSEDQLGVLPRFGAAARVDAALELSGGWQLIAAVTGNLDFIGGRFVYRDGLLGPRSVYAPPASAVQVGLGLGLEF
jgi:hypothetical protein